MVDRPPSGRPTPGGIIGASVERPRGAATGHPSTIHPGDGPYRRALGPGRGAGGV